MRSLSTEQEGTITGPITEPQYLVYIELDQPYYWSTREAATALGQDWIPGGVQVRRASPSRAELRVENDDWRHTQNAVSGVYQRGQVQIYWAYPIPDSLYVEADYWDDDYVTPENPPEPELLFEGLIYSCPNIGWWIDIDAQRTPPRLYPHKKIRPPFANHLPAAGYMVTFDGATLRIENE